MNSVRVLSVASEIYPIIKTGGLADVSVSATNVGNPTITVMRTTPEECLELGRQIGRKLSSATGPVALYIPLRGISMIAVEGQVFHDPEADAARDRRRDARVGQVQLERVHICLVRLHRPFVLLDERRLRIHLLARDGVLREQHLVALQIEPRGLQQRPVLGERE